MKHLITILSLIILFGAFTANAQNKAIDKLYEKYSEVKGFTAVNISSDLFALMASGKPEAEQREFTDLIKDIQLMRVLNFTKSGNDDKVLKDFIKDIDASINFNEYSKLMEVKDGPSRVHFLNKKINNNLSEFIMIVTEADEATVISIIGNLDLNKLRKISQQTGIKGMEQIQDLNK